jgi:hypothetical protein
VIPLAADRLPKSTNQFISFPITGKPSEVSVAVKTRDPPGAMVKLEGEMESEVGLFSGLEIEVPPNSTFAVFTADIFTVKETLLGRYWSSPAKDAVIVTEPTASGAV